MFPFLLIVTVVSLVLMFSIGRDARDVMQLISNKLSVDSSMDLSDYSENKGEKYSLKYYYGDGTDTTLYADFSQKEKGGEVTYSLTLYEPRNGFEPGYYKTEWFHSEEYVTYAPLDDKNNETSNRAEEQSYIYDYIKSYSYDGLMSELGADSINSTDSFKILGLGTVFQWSFDGRENYMWGLGNTPIELYSYIFNGSSEYKKVSIRM